MIKMASAPLPNHSLNQSITHYIVLIAAFEKRIKNRRQPTHGKLVKESFSSLDTIDVPQDHQ
jgi:hypothetical protein